MIEPIRDYILAAEGAADDSLEAEEFDDKQENEVSQQISPVCRSAFCVRLIVYRDVNVGFLGKPVISFGKPVLYRLSVLLTFIKI